MPQDEPKALYRKYRPQSWDAVVGQQHVVDTLRNALAAGRIAHAYLFAGPRGTGKTTTARLLAKAVNCLHDDLASRPCSQCEYCLAVSEGRFLDLIEIDAASNTSVDDVRDLRDKINFSPNQGRYKVYIIDEVHMLSQAAFNALLKTLEEPPAHAIFILATTEVHKIPATVLSRCQRHEFRRLSLADITATLKKIAEDENIAIDDAALMAIARQSTGAMRDAISLLDQLASFGGRITLETAQQVLGTAANQSVLELVQALVGQQAGAGLENIHKTLDSGSDARQFARQVVEYLRGILLVQMKSTELMDVTQEVRELMGSHAAAFSTAELLRVIRIFNFAASEARSPWQPALPLEMAFIDAMQKPAAAGSTPGVESKPVPVPASSTVSPTRTSEPQKPAPEKQAAPAQKSEAPTPGDTAVEQTPQDRQNTQTLADAWQKLKELVRRQSPRAQGLLNSCTGHYMRGNEVFLVFASDILKEKMQKPENLQPLEQALVQVFQRAILVKCQVDTAKRDTLPPGVEDDGMVATALRDLGGEIVDVQ